MSNRHYSDLFGPQFCNVWNFKEQCLSESAMFASISITIFSITLWHQVPPLIDLQSGGQGSDPVKQVFFPSHLVPISAFLCFPVQLRFLPWACTQCTLHRPLFRSLWTRCKIDSTALSSLKTFSTPVSSPEVIPCSLIVDFLYSPNKCTHFSIILKIHF